MKRKYNLLLGLILLVGFLIRTIGLTDSNTGFYVDEASIGYNARSIWETGSDEYGQKFPLAFRSFGDYKSPLFVYVNVPMVSIFGEVRGVRLTTAVLGVITIWLVAEVAKKLSEEKAGLLAGVILATLPWHVNLSRHGVEAVLATALLAGATLLVIKKRYVGGLLMLALSTLAYHATKYVSPLLALMIAIRLWPERKGLTRNKLGWALVSIVWLSVLLINLQPFSNTRALGVSSINNDVFQTARNVIANYLTYFNPKVLMLGDDIAINNMYGISNVSILVVFLFFVGIWRVFKKKSFGSLLVLTILFLSPLPASATIDPFHAIRALIMVVPLSILAGIGGKWLLDKYLHSRGAGVVLVGLIVVIGFQVLDLSEKMLVQNKLTAYEGWIGGYQQLVEQVVDLDTDKYLKVVVDTTDIPAIYSLWQVFGKVDTRSKIPLTNGTSYYEQGWRVPESLTLKNGQIVFFKPVYWPEDQKQASVLYVGSVWRFDPDAIKRAGAKVVTEIKDPTGKVVWMAVATKP